MLPKLEELLSRPDSSLLAREVMVVRARPTGGLETRGGEVGKYLVVTSMEPQDSAAEVLLLYLQPQKPLLLYRATEKPSKKVLLPSSPCASFPRLSQAQGIKLVPLGERKGNSTPKALFGSNHLSEKVTQFFKPSEAPPNPDIQCRERSQGGRP